MSTSEQRKKWRALGEKCRTATTATAFADERELAAAVVVLADEYEEWNSAYGEDHMRLVGELRRVERLYSVQYAKLASCEETLRKVKLHCVALIDAELGEKEPH